MNHQPPIEGVITQGAPEVPQAINRLTALLNVYHEVEDEQPQQLGGSFTTKLSSEDSARKFKGSLEPGCPKYVTDLVGQGLAYVVALNITGRNPRVKPSDEELEKLKSKEVTLLAAHVEFASLPPGEAVLLNVSHYASNLQLLASEPDTRVIVWGVPK